jgi:ornithine cyclodeaminase/alanine dehydrogenase-like protein (mu-crystallin family)
MGAALGVEVTPVAQPEDAIGGADIALCATNSIDNIFFERWIEPGMHISSIKITEIELAAIRRVDRLVLHTHDDKPLHVTTAGLDVAEKRGGKGWALGKGIDFSRTPTLAEVISGGKPLRRSDGEVTCFINNLGLGYQFAAAGAVVYRKAREAGLGHDLPTDWFTQDVHP